MTEAKAASASTRSSVKRTVKSVKFEEPDKENIEPETASKEPIVNGLRGRPTRRGASTSSRATGADLKSTTQADQKKPLSPKKVTQISVSRGDPDSSEDELAAARKKTPIKPMMMSPIKPPSRLLISDAKHGQAYAKDGAELTAELDAAVLDAYDPNDAALASPARRPPTSPLKDTMRSPAKRIGTVSFPSSAPKPSDALTAGETSQTSPLKSSLLMSAAKRPTSPIKMLKFSSSGSPLKSLQSHSAAQDSMLLSPAKRAMPGCKLVLEARLKSETSDLTRSPEMKPLVAATPLPARSKRPLEKLTLEEQTCEDGEGDPIYESPDSLSFPGRLSAVMPRFVNPDPATGDPTECEGEGLVEGVQASVQTIEAIRYAEPRIDASSAAFAAHSAEDDVDPMALDITAAVAESLSSGFVAVAEAHTAALKPGNSIYQLRQKDLDDFHELSNFEDETNSPTKVLFAHDGTSPVKENRRATMGLTSLTDQLNSWSAASPAKSPIKASKVETSHQLTHAHPPVVPEASTSDSFFEDEMSVRLGPGAAGQTPGASQPIAEIAETSFDDIMVTNEDLGLAQEANEMSLMGPEQAGVAAYQYCDDGLSDGSLSDGSQEYGDENEVPIDPALLSPDSEASPVTPRRPLPKGFNTTTKVPLKPADNSTPSPLKQRSLSASRVSLRRPAAMPRSATVISLSPTKSGRRSSFGYSLPQTPASGAPVEASFGTPSQSVTWSSKGTPARTPRKDLNPSLLRGAIVFVDVHTSEGADASGIFVDLLTQMGARCLKSWTWDPDSAPEPSSGSDRIGVTHVVYKDGEKRTLEKVRQSNGVVQCVGVAWVLE